MTLQPFDEDDYGGFGGDDEPVGPFAERDDRGGGDPRERVEPCPGPPHHNPRCCLAPKSRPVLRRIADMIRGDRDGDRA